MTLWCEMNRKWTKFVRRTFYTPQFFTRMIRELYISLYSSRPPTKCNTYHFSMAKLVTRTRLNVLLHVHSLACYFCATTCAGLWFNKLHFAFWQFRSVCYTRYSLFALTQSSVEACSTYWFILRCERDHCQTYIVDDSSNKQRIIGTVSI